MSDDRPFWVDSATSLLRAFIGSLLLLELPINLTFAAGTQLVESAKIAWSRVDENLIVTAAARHEIPCFPGLGYADWIKFRKPLTDNRDQVYRLRNKALAICWPS